MVEIISSHNLEDLNKEIDKKEKLGWSIVPESLTVTACLRHEQTYGKEVIEYSYSIAIKGQNK